MRRRRLVLAVLAPVVLAGCTAGPSTRPAVVSNDGPVPQQQTTSAQAIPLPELTEPNSPSVQWSDCDGQTRERLGNPGVPDTLRFSCARVQSVLDAPAAPGRGIVNLAILKAGTGTIPLVVVNDIDGEPGTLYAARLAATLPAEILQRFSLVGVDRRGTGQSDAVGCVPPEVREQLLGQDPAEQNIQPLLDAAGKAGQQCAIDLVNELQSLDSWRGAGDLEEIRDQLGMGKLNALARGEGSKVLTAYATRYTSRVGRFVLDGVPDPSVEPATVLGDLAAARQSTLDAFGADCAARGCPLGRDATGVVTALTEQLRAAPALLPEGTTFGPALALYSVTAGLAQRARWPELADAIQAARGGDPTRLAVFAEPLVGGSVLLPPRLDAVIATKCNDTATRMPANQISTLAGSLRTKSPVFGGLVTQLLVWCGPWPTRSEALPPFAVSGAPPILVVSTATDPVTPEPGTVRAAEQLPSGVRVAWQGTGHGATGSPCVGEAVRGFLVDGKVPTDGTLCPA